MLQAHLRWSHLPMWKLESVRCTQLCSYWEPYDVERILLLGREAGNKVISQKHKGLEGTSGDCLVQPSCTSMFPTVGYTRKGPKLDFTVKTANSCWAAWCCWTSHHLAMQHYSQKTSPHSSWGETGSRHRIPQLCNFSSLNTDSVQTQSYRAHGSLRLWNLNSQDNRIIETSRKYSPVARCYLTNPRYKQTAGELVWCKPAAALAHLPFLRLDCMFQFHSWEHFQ